MNREQRGSAAKYFYDLSKGCLLAGMVGMVTDKLGGGAFGMLVLLSLYGYFAAFQLEVKLT